ncbi:hypothetical protein L6R49_30760 [Myxococcota bacterium]|nr:hypothetical protein [Myxococcota bacterium]
MPSNHKGSWAIVLMAAGMSSCGEPTIEELCAGEGDPALILGHGEGSEFVAFEPGEEVYITVAPQGGFGVTIRASTSGLYAGADQGAAPISLVLRSRWKGEPSGEFDWGDVVLYCTEDGSGLFWGAIVPLDPEMFPTEADLEQLDGERVELEAEATDARGEVVIGVAEVTLRLRDTG